MPVKKRFTIGANNGNINSYWFIEDKLQESKRIDKGSYKNMVFKCYHLNKNYYREVNKNTELCK